MSKIPKQTIVLTLFEKQVIRNIILNNNGELIRSLMDNFNLIILTNSELYSILKTFLAQLDIPEVSIRNVKAIKPNLLYKVLNVFAKNMNSSSSNKWSRNRNYRLRNFSFFGLLVRNLINLLFARHKLFHEMLRVLMRYLVYCRDPDISKVIRESNIIILTSVTNFTWDVPIGQIAARKKIKIIAIPRSWDNFTSHGAIRVKPHKIFSFSASMTRYLITYHFFNHAQIIEVRNPAYDYEYYKPIKNSLNPSRSKKILYACMGSYLHENESIFINHLSNIVKKSGFELEILMHPKFETSLVNGIHCNVIPYDKFSTVDLLKQHLSQFRLILTAGSSIAIDCYNYGLDFCCIFIEVLPIDYWRSILRYVDTVEHFSDFLAIHDVRVLKNFNQIAIELESLESNQIYKSKTATDKSDHTPLIKDALLTTINCILSP